MSPKSRYWESHNSRNDGRHRRKRRRARSPQLLLSHRRPDYSKSTRPGIFSRGFGSVPNLLAWDCRLNLEQHAILDYLLIHVPQNPNDKEQPPVAFPSLRTIAGDLWCSPNRVRRILRELETMGYIRTGKRDTNRSRANVYIMDCLTAEWWERNRKWFQPPPPVKRIT